MKHLLAVGLLALSLTGCGTLGGLFQPVHAPTTIEGETAVQKANRLAHAALYEAYVDLNALNVVIGNNAEASVWTKAQAQAALDESIAARRKVDKAYEALKLGNITDATSQAELIKAVILALQKKVAEAARKEP